MITQKQAWASVGAGIGLAVLAAVVNGLSTYVFDGETLESKVLEQVGA